jgi:PilZ domain-containing protein
MTHPERRRDSRKQISLPVHVHGHDSAGALWEEVSHTLDVSSGGVSFHLKRRVEVGHVLHLSLPMPKNLRRFDLAEPSYRVYALVRDIVYGSETRVGVMLLGRTPPRAYAQDPTGKYLLEGDQRQYPRYELHLNVRLRRLGSGLPGAREELTVTENLGRRGARVKTALPIAKGEAVVLEEVRRAFQEKSEVTSVTIGADNVPRLGLRFVDEAAPERMRAVLEHYGFREEP